LPFDSAWSRVPPLRGSGQTSIPPTGREQAKVPFGELI
jgi:hypothetical protein